MSIFGNKDLDLNAEYAWSRYLHGIAWGGAQVPSTKEEMLEGFVQSFADHCRSEIAPAWPSDAAQQIESALEKIPEREARALKMHFGIGYADPRSYELIGKAVGNVSRGRAQQIVASAVRRLQSPTYRHLEQLWRNKYNPPPPRMTGRLIPPSTDPFELILDELETWLSPHTRNALRGGGVKTVGDLAQKQKNELRGMRNFGDKCLSEVLTLLAHFGLTLGMTIKQ